MTRISGYGFLAALSVIFFSACATSTPQIAPAPIQENYRPSGQPQAILNTIDDWHDRCLAAGGKDCRIDITALTDGWQVDISVAGTSKETAPRNLSGFHMNSRNWMECQVDAEHFTARGGKNNLLDIMDSFYQWMKE
jgi:hypothetical protein